ncbi:hypothetical protein M758_UG103600 [Ceratodon purpureus]|nr:hypothetical protein M758_UG103600 [Ceratodon purpureus]
MASQSPLKGLLERTSTLDQLWDGGPLDMLHNIFEEQELLQRDGPSEGLTTPLTDWTNLPILCLRLSCAAKGKAVLLESNDNMGFDRDFVVQILEVPAVVVSGGDYWQSRAKRGRLHYSKCTTKTQNLNDAHDCRGPGRGRPRVRGRGAVLEAVERGRGDQHQLNKAVEVDVGVEVQEDLVLLRSLIQPPIWMCFFSPL